MAVTRFCEQPDLLHVGGTKDPDIAAIVRLAPDVVVVDEEENRREDADALRAAGLDVHVLAVRAVADVAPALAGLRERLGLPAEPSAELPPPRPTTRTAFVPIWRRPWMALGGDTYGTSLLEHLGVGNVFADRADATRYPEVTLAHATARRPDLVLAPSEPYPFAARHRPELGAVASVVVLVDGQDLFWWGERTPRALVRLGAVLDGLD